MRPIVDIPAAMSTMLASMPGKPKAILAHKVITVEEHSVIGGLGDAVADVLMGKVNCKFHKIGVNDRFGQSGKAADVLREYGLTADQIAETIKANI